MEPAVNLPIEGLEVGNLRGLTGDHRTVVPGTSMRVFLSLWLIYALFLNPYPASLASNMLDLAVSLVDNHSVELNLYKGGIDVSMREGRYFSGLPPGGSLPAVVVYGLLRLFHPPFTKTVDLMTLSLICTLLITAPVSALCVTLVYRLLCRLPILESTRLWTAGLFAFGTMHFGYATMYAKEPIVALILLFTFSLISVEEGRSRGTWLRPLGLGLLFGYGIATIYAAVIPIGVLLIYFTVRWRGKSLRWVLLGLVLGIIPLLVYHQVAYGSPFANAYTYHGYETSKYIHLPDFSRFLSIMFSPREGLLIYTPVLLLGVVGGWRAFRGGIWRGELACIAGILFATWLFYACYGLPLIGEYPLPHEAHPSPRYFHSIMGFGMIPIALGLERTRFWLARVLGGVSVFFAYLSAQAGLLPQFEFAVVYALKVWASTFGVGMLFGQFLPERLGVETLHTLLRRPEIRFMDLLSSPGPVLIGVIARQAWFFMAFLVALSLVSAILWMLWRDRFTPQNRPLFSAWIRNQAVKDEPQGISL